MWNYCLKSNHWENYRCLEYLCCKVWFFFYSFLSQVKTQILSFFYYYYSSGVLNRGGAQVTTWVHCSQYKSVCIFNHQRSLRTRGKSQGTTVLYHILLKQEYKKPWFSTWTQRLKLLLLPFDLLTTQELHTAFTHPHKCNKVSLAQRSFSVKIAPTSE